MGAMGGAPPLPVPVASVGRGIHSGEARTLRDPGLRGLGPTPQRLDYWLDYELDHELGLWARTIGDIGDVGNIGETIGDY